MSIIEVFHASYKQLSKDQQELLKGKILDEIKEEFLLIQCIEGNYPISLRKALAWIDSEPNDYLKYRNNFKARFIKNNPYFREAESEDDPHGMYIEKIDGKGREVYFSIKGLEYFCMMQKTPKANAIKAYFSNIVHNYHLNIKLENKNLKKENEGMKEKIDMDFITQKFQMFSEQIFKVDCELKKLKDIYELKKSESGKVYFIHEAGSEQGFKIGFTRREIEERIVELQTGNSKELKVYKCVPYQDCQKLENYLHNRFADKQIRGEWFNVNLEEVEDILKLLEL